MWGWLWQRARVSRGACAGSFSLGFAYTVANSHSIAYAIAYSNTVSLSYSIAGADTTRPFMDAAGGQSDGRPRLR